MKYQFESCLQNVRVVAVIINERQRLELRRSKKKMNILSLKNKKSQVRHGRSQICFDSVYFTVRLLYQDFSDPVKH